MAAQAEGQPIGAMGERVARIEGACEHLATKADVESVKTDANALKVAVESHRTETQTEFQALRAEVQSFRTEMHSEIAGVKSELRWIEWALGVLVVGVLLPICTRCWSVFPERAAGRWQNSLG